MEAREKIGNIRLAETLGEGGMGTVWAGYDEKLRREVAVKTIRRDRVDLETRARLLAEARILSQLDHPNICRLYDYVEGEDSDFLVLERIRGRTLAEAMASGLGGAEKLRIAEDIARTLVVAHARGIVHRDLKPSNVMLAENSDGRPDGGRHEQLKVLDFGLARSLDGPEEEMPAEQPADARAASRAAAMSDGTLTRLGSIVLRGEAGRVTGTPANMSPEQARGEAATAASDMYSFGLLLRELFTGRPAYPLDLPSDRLLTKAADGDTLPVEGTGREVKAMIERLEAFAPEERPAASEAAARLRYFRDRPKRRRRWLVAAAIVAAFASGGIKYVLDQKRERDKAVAARQDAEVARREAEVARREAEQVTGFMVELFEVSDPSEALGREVSAREILDRGAERIAGELTGQPLVRARIMSTIGLVYQSLGDYDRAMELESQALDVRREILGDGSLEIADSLENLGSLAYFRGRYQESERLLERSLEIRERILGPDHPDVATALHNLATIYTEQGDLERAEALYRRALEIRERTFGTDHRMVVVSLGSLAVLVGNRGALEEAEALYQRVLDIQERILEPDHPDVAAMLQNFATLLYRRGEAGRAVPLYRRALAIRERVLGEHLDTAITRYSLAALLGQKDDPGQAEALYRRALETMEGTVGADHPDLAHMQNGLADFYRRLGRHEQAAPLLRRALEVKRRSFGPDHHQVGTAWLSLGSLHRLSGEDGEAGVALRKALEISERALARNPDDVEHLVTSAKALLYLGRVDEARPQVEKLLAKGRRDQDLLELARDHGLSVE